MIINSGKLKKGQLKDHVIIITGAGGGIGFEAARALVWLGAEVVLAEINKDKGKLAEKQINEEFNCKKAHFVHTDVSDESSIKNLYNYSFKNFGKVDVVFNNATIAPIGAADEVDIKVWDQSYKTNLRGPVLLTRYFLPEMKKRNKGTIIFVSSSGAAPFLGIYEVFKTAQVELSNTLSAELENSEISVFTIGPGIVKTETATKAIEKIAPMYGKTVEEFFSTNKNVLISPEEAGAGFAAAIVFAYKYRGQEVSSIQALIDAGINLDTTKTQNNNMKFTSEELKKIKLMFNKIKTTYFEQKISWYKRNIFERQWVIRDFKKSTGFSPENYVEQFNSFEHLLDTGNISASEIHSLSLEKLSKYYQHQADLLKGYEKNQKKVEENLKIIQGWVEDIQSFNKIVSK